MGFYGSLGLPLIPERWSVRGIVLWAHGIASGLRCRDSQLLRAWFPESRGQIPHVLDAHGVEITVQRS